MSRSGTEKRAGRRVPVRWLIGVVAVAFLAIVIRGLWVQGARPEIVVYKSPTCGCCSAWVEHLRAHGFAVTTRDVLDLAAVRRRLHVPEQLASCHTATVGDYVVQGHVPAREIDRLLASRPPVVGLAVPDMPVGSPGMESGSRHEPYDVLAFGTAGDVRVFASYR